MTVAVRDLDRARSLYSGMLGMRETMAWSLDADVVGQDAQAARMARTWGLTDPLSVVGVDLEQPGTAVGAMRLIRVGDGSHERINQGASNFAHGYVKNLDYFTDDVRGQYERFVGAGFKFLAPPLDYAVPWGQGAIATEAHLPTEDGVKISLARMAGVPRIAMGRSGHASSFTEVAAVTQIVKDFERAEAFYCDVLDLIPAAPTVIEGDLIEALHLPPQTRLRMSFLSGREAAGGRLGIVSYQGPAVAFAQDLRARMHAPYRGVLGLTFEVADVEGVTRRALALGATLRCEPDEQVLGGVSTFGATVVSPDGIPLHLESAATTTRIVTGDDSGSVGGFTAVGRVDELEPGSIREHRPKDGSSRLALANVAGEVFAFEDRCPHLGAPLSRGQMRGRTLVCPWHGWMIDVPTGQVVGGRGLAIRPCGVRVTEGNLEVTSLKKADA